MDEEKKSTPTPGSYICTYILFVVVTFIFGIIPHRLYFAFNVLYFVFRKVSFLYCHFNFCFFAFVFCV